MALAKSLPSCTIDRVGGVSTALIGDPTVPARGHHGHQPEDQSRWPIPRGSDHAEYVQDQPGCQRNQQHLAVDHHIAVSRRDGPQFCDDHCRGGELYRGPRPPRSPPWRTRPWTSRRTKSRSRKSLRRRSLPSWAAKLRRPRKIQPSRTRAVLKAKRRPATGGPFCFVGCAGPILPQLM
jgi:hypothetical protein